MTNDKNRGSGTLRLRPSEIRFSQDSIMANFKDGRSVHGLYEELRSGQKRLSSVRRIRVVKNENMQHISLDNRRLYVFRALEYEGELSHIYVLLVKKSDYFYGRFSTNNEGTSVKIRGGGTRPLPHSIEEMSTSDESQSVRILNVLSRGSKFKIAEASLPKPDKNFEQFDQFLKIQGAIRRRVRDIENLQISPVETPTPPTKSNVRRDTTTNPVETPTVLKKSTYARRDVTTNRVFENAAVTSGKEIGEPAVSRWQTPEYLFEDHRSVQHQRYPSMSSFPVNGPRHTQRKTEYPTPVKKDELPDGYDLTRGYEGWGSLAIFTATSVLGGLLLWRYYKSGNESKFEFAGTSATKGIQTENSSLVTVVESMPALHDKAVNTVSESAVDVFEEGPSVLGTMWNGVKFTLGWGTRGLLYAIFGSFKLLAYTCQFIPKVLSAIPSKVARGRAEILSSFNPAVNTISQIAAEVSEEGPSVLGSAWNGAKFVFGWGIRGFLYAVSGSFRLLTYLCQLILEPESSIPSAVSRKLTEMANWFNPGAFSG